MNELKLDFPNTGQLSPDIYTKIEELIKKHHSIYRFPVKGELWEDIFDQSLNNGVSEWSCGGHDVGYDVTDLVSGIRFQNKAGVVDFTKGTLNWSGHRTTRYKTIEEKVEFISSDHCDYYVMLARNKREWNSDDKKYYVFIFNSELIDYSKLEWVDNFNGKGNLCGWVGNSKSSNYSANIQISMSHQLWTSASLDILPPPYIIQV